MVCSFPIFRSTFVRYPSITHCFCPNPRQLWTDELSPNISLIRSTKPLLRLFSDVVAGFPPHDGASVLACAYQLKVRSQNPKDFEHWFSQRLWIKFAMFLLNSTSVDAGAIIGG